MRALALLSIAALGGSLILNAAGTSMADDAETETPANIIAAQIRKQGYVCDNPKTRGARRRSFPSPTCPCGP